MYSSIRLTLYILENRKFSITRRLRLRDCIAYAVCIKRKKLRCDLLLHILRTAWFVCCLFGTGVSAAKCMNRSRCGLGRRFA